MTRPNALRNLLILMKQYIRKADIILLIFLVIAGLAATAALSMSRSDAGSDAKVIIESGGDLYGSFSLYEDRTIIVPSPQENASRLSIPDDDKPAAEQFTHYNVVVISGGTVTVTEASCKNQVCVKHSAISRSGESIVCLPNRLAVRIESGNSGEGDGYDSVTS